MQNDRPKKKLFPAFLRGLIETGFIVFLFYSNLLMGEYNGTGHGRQKGLAWAVNDIFTKDNLLIALAASLIGYVVFEFMRKKI